VTGIGLHLAQRFLTVKMLASGHVPDFQWFQIFHEMRDDRFNCAA
jgi:hypothetical protein